MVGGGGLESWRCIVGRGGLKSWRCMAVLLAHGSCSLKLTNVISFNKSPGHGE